MTQGEVDIFGWGIAVGLALALVQILILYFSERKK